MGTSKQDAAKQDTGKAEKGDKHVSAASAKRKTAATLKPRRKRTTTRRHKPHGPASRKVAAGVEAATARLAREDVVIDPWPETRKPDKKQRKPVRDSFTMPAADFALIGVLKDRALDAKRETKKSELLRAGLHILATLDTPALISALDTLTPIKVGRPKKRH